MKPLKPIKKSERGSFTRWAKEHGFSTVQEAASHVMANTSKYPDSIVKKANYAHNIGGAHVKKAPSMLESIASNK